jgi:hypothetical protein
VLTCARYRFVIAEFRPRIREPEAIAKVHAARSGRAREAHRRSRACSERRSDPAAARDRSETALSSVRPAPRIQLLCGTCDAAGDREPSERVRRPAIPSSRNPQFGTAGFALAHPVDDLPCPLLCIHRRFQRPGLAPDAAVHPEIVPLRHVAHDDRRTCHVNAGAPSSSISRARAASIRSCVYRSSPPNTKTSP